MEGRSEVKCTIRVNRSHRPPPRRRTRAQKTSESVAMVRWTGVETGRETCGTKGRIDVEKKRTKTDAGGNRATKRKGSGR